jgi:alkaline phosphatase
MTRKAISLLDSTAPPRHDDGFFLQVEGASIDKQDHAANACAQIGETVAFDNAIGVALEYQRSHPDTLIVVTADHAHTSQIVGGGLQRRQRADRLVGQPGHQGRPDAADHLRHRRRHRRLRPRGA